LKLQLQTGKLNSRRLLTDAFAFRHRNFSIDAWRLNVFHSSTGPSYFDLIDGRNRTKAEMQS
jgi:hypothetical protein